jgi:exodeoxyribonuclease-5
VVRESHHFEDAAKHAEMVIVGFNKTRHYMNTLLRKHNKFEDALPEPGEKLICLMNNKERGMYNGMSVRVLNRKDQYKTTLYLDLVDDLGNLYEDVATHIPQYGVNSLRATHRSRDVLLFDWNYAQTAHKSQGSEYKHVAVLEEIVREWDECRWRYTVATRASELLEYYK